ncbi:MAG: hypothetical protein ACOZF0_22860 [Thermodesulfobacteriota bacterium]
MPKKEKNITLDAMMKVVLNKYGLATKKDIEKLMAQIENLEKLIKKNGRGSLRGLQTNESRLGPKTRKRGSATAADIALEVIKTSKKGADFAEIQTKTGFPDKKLRNIIFRLNRLGKIKRKSRGIYVVV